MRCSKRTTSSIGRSKSKPNQRMSNQSKLRHKIIKNNEFYDDLRNFLVFNLANVCHGMTDNRYYFCHPKNNLRMSITIKPTRIKQSVYLLIPKNIADLIEIKNSNKIVLDIKKKGRGKVLEYSIK